MFIALIHTDKTLPYVHGSGTDNIVCFIAYSQKCSQSCVHSSDTHNTLSCVHSADTENTLSCVDSSDTENKGCSRNVRCSNNWHRQLHGTLAEMFTVLCSQLRLTQTANGCLWYASRTAHSRQWNRRKWRLQVKKCISHQRQPKAGRPKRSRACTEAEKKEKREK